MEEFRWNLLHGENHVFANLLACDFIGHGASAIDRDDNLLFGHILEGKRRFSGRRRTRTHVCTVIWVIWLVCVCVCASGKRANSHCINDLVDILFQLDRYEQNVLKRENSISISYKTKVARMLFIVVIIFIVLHIPFTALIFIRNQLLKSLVMDQIDGWFYILWYTSHYLLYLNAAVNPIIYGLTNDNFRRAYHQTPLLPQRARFWSTLAKKLKNKNHNEVRMNFGVVITRTYNPPIHPHTHSSCGLVVGRWARVRVPVRT